MSSVIFQVKCSVLFTALIRRMREGTIFSLFTLAGHSRSRCEVPNSADGDTPSKIRMGGTLGYTPPRHDGDTPLSRPGMGGILGYSHPRLDGVPPVQDWMWYPHPRLDGVPPIQDWMGYPPPHSRLDGVPPVHDWMGYPLHQKASTYYAAGGVPLEFTQEDFLVHLKFIT